jgi:hypothetical protein
MVGRRGARRGLKAGLRTGGLRSGSEFRVCAVPRSGSEFPAAAGYAVPGGRRPWTGGIACDPERQDDGGDPDADHSLWASWASGSHLPFYAHFPVVHQAPDMPEKVGATPGAHASMPEKAGATPGAQAAALHAVPLCQEPFHIPSRFAPSSRPPCSRRVLRTHVCHAVMPEHGNGIRVLLRHRIVRRRDAHRTHGWRRCAGSGPGGCHARRAGG